MSAKLFSRRYCVIVAMGQATVASPRVVSQMLISKPLDQCIAFARSRGFVVNHRAIRALKLAETRRTHQLNQPLGKSRALKKSHPKAWAAISWSQSGV